MKVLNNGHIWADSIKSALSIVPVVVFNSINQLSMSTYTLLDNESTNSFCTKNLALQLCATGHEEMSSLNTHEKASKKHTIPVVTLRVSDFNQEHILEINTVCVRMELPIDLNNMATSVDASSLPHLSSLELPEQI